MKQNGGKADSLLKLKNAHVRIPPFFVCSSTTTKNDITDKIRKHFSDVNFFAVRSSGIHEDSKRTSQAGKYYSALAVTKEDVWEEYKKVLSSLESAQGSVIIQEFIPSDTSGVLFSKTKTGEVLINSTVGLCIAVVSGEACDEYVCTQDGRIIKQKIEPKKKITEFVHNNLSSRHSSEPSITSQQIKQLCKMAKRLEKLFGSPQDIEWCFYHNKLYILQSRPITREVTSGLNKLLYFDSANISESYAGIVLPLTCSFAQKVYAQVYRDLLRHSGVPNKEIVKYPDIFDKLLGFFSGRMYYNMNNWYLLGAFLPGYNRNKQNFELMITSNIKEQISYAIKPSIVTTLRYPFILFNKLMTFDKSSVEFMAFVNATLTRFRTYKLQTLSYRQLVKLFTQINGQLLSRWYITVENDFLVMTYLGILKKLIGEKEMQKHILFSSKATQQIFALTQLSNRLYKEKTLWKAIQTNNVSVFNKELVKSVECKKLLDSYLVTFGGRFAYELKLESIGVDEDPKKLFSLLRAYKNYSQPSFPKPTKNKSLPLSKKILYTFVLRKFIKYAQRREEFRILRSNTFGITRSIVRQMGKILVDEKRIKKIDDIFYLHLEEVLHAHTSNKKLESIIVKRKKEYSTYKTITPPSHFATDTPNPSFESIDSNVQKELIARPASMGTITGKVKIFKQFSLPNKIDFDILVTSHTDPGWTSLIALSKGLIVEHGGVLSHASIVARELHIPAVIGATGAVSLLKDEQIVTIDGSTGKIIIHP